MNVAMIGLYVKSHRLGRAVLLLFALGVVAWVWGQYLFHMPSLRSSESVVVPVILIVPVASAVVVGVSTRTWMGGFERIAPRRLALWRLAHALILCSIGVACLVPAIDSGYGSYGSVAALRNILGYAGMAFLCASVAGGGLSWVLPLAYALPVPLLGVDHYHNVLWWAWPLHPADSYLSWTWALTFFVVGLSAYVVSTPRDTVASGEDEQ
ncbi:hypothetical protein [Nitrolancea hollandica]|uniref:hypothetical protein n=1 Tax=Nitrolancea hollandica TaxID=1206749 RepID=UPI00058ED8CD|nr:hypothetical protein [Nitrolancea hollandica]